MSWLNNDKLYLKYGTEKTRPNNDGEYRTDGAEREIELIVDLTTLTETETILSDQVFFPKMRIEEIEVVARTAAASGVAIDLGLIKTDRATQIDYDGFLAAFPLASMNADGMKSTVRVGSTGAGTLIGENVTESGYITASRTTATAFTAGELSIRIRYTAAV